jgi:nitrite reductase/ring-hydroxylating ferredoxin subunit
MSDQVKGDAPYAVELGGEKIVLFRDGQGTLRALEDRCPHRRVPLSMGRMTPEGNLQCGYHGWTFSGASGELVGIPNLSEGERVLPCTIERFEIVERNAVVYGWAGDTENADESQIATLNYVPAVKTFCGRQKLVIEHGEFVAALLDAPDLLIKITGLMFDPRVAMDPFIDNDQVITERNVRWNWLGEAAFYLGPLRSNPDCPLLLRVHTVPVTGHSHLQIVAIDGTILVDVMLICTPASRGITDVHWQAGVADSATGKAATVLRGLAAAGFSPFGMRKSVVGQALADTLPTLSDAWREASLARNHSRPQNADNVSTLNSRR